MHPDAFPEGPLEDPLARFRVWWDAARAETAHLEPDAMVLSTVADGQPSSRVVYLRAFDASGDGGFVFYTNLESIKGRAIAGNARVALNFHWAKHERQVRVEGTAARVDDATADAYWLTRARESQIGGWASQQSRLIPEGETLEHIVAETARRFGDGPVPRPPHWSGLRVTPTMIELWRSGVHRLHHRDRYARTAAGWTRAVLFP